MPGPSIRFHISSFASVLVVNVALSVDEVYTSTALTDSMHASTNSHCLRVFDIKSVCMHVVTLLAGDNLQRKQDSCRCKINIIITITFNK